MLNRGSRARMVFAAGAFAASLGVSSIAAAQPAANPALPRSPYALPTPTYNGPDDQDLVLGGDVRNPENWRHWGDSRNEGETFKEIFAPNGVLGGGPADARANYYERQCNLRQIC